jgi:tryptophanyl-tRNA synthetase
MRLFTGFRPTGRLHLGNLATAGEGIIDAARMNQTTICMVADLHALTAGPDPEIRRRCIEVTKDLMAIGAEHVFRQSDVPAHSELAAILGMVTPVSWLERIPTVKDRDSYGHLGYPVLQAADILLYAPCKVPVGKDQVPHIQSAADIANRFNRLTNSDALAEFYLQTNTDKVLPGLDMRKMSKSLNNCIYIADTAEETLAKVMQAYTTPTKIKASDPGVPEGCAACHYLLRYDPDGAEKTEACARGACGCVVNKRAAAEAINEYLRDTRLFRAMIEDGDAETQLRIGAEEATKIANETLARAKRAVGL